MSLFRNFAVLRQHKGNPFAPIQILTGDTRKPCNAQRDRLHDERRSFQRKSRIERRFESSPESRGSQTSGVLLVLFVHAKRINPFPFREAPRLRKPRISVPQPQLRTATIKNFLRKLRGFANLEAAHKTTTSHDPIKSFFPPYGGAPFRAARSACIPPPSAASQKRKDPFCL